MKEDSIPEKFDICDDITSGYMEGFCQSVQSEMGDIQRKSSADLITKPWPLRARLAFKKLRTAASGFFDQRASTEIDMSGTARVAMEYEESDSLENNFLEKVKLADKCRLTTYTAGDFTEADKELNLDYSKIINKKIEGHEWEWGTVTKAGIKSTQVQWIKYRDAWVAFIASHCPRITSASIKTILTKERISQLKEFLE